MSHKSCVSKVIFTFGEQGCLRKKRRFCSVWTLRNVRLLFLLLGMFLGELALPFVIGPYLSAQPTPCTGAAITGRAFRDYNANGVLDADEPGIAGICEVCSEPYPDVTQFDAVDPHFDPKSNPEQPRWWLRDVAFECKTRLLTLAELRACPELAGMRLLARGINLLEQKGYPAARELVDLVTKP